MAKKTLATKGTKVDLAQDVSPSMRNVVEFVSKVGYSHTSSRFSVRVRVIEFVSKVGLGY